MSPRKKAEKARGKLAGKDRSSSLPLSVENVRTLKATFFSSLPEWHTWLEEYHEIRQELWVGFHKKASGKPSITWPEAVDGALCFGWIDGLRKSLGDSSYVIRFTPRRPRSVWSSVNIRRVSELTKQGLMRSAGVQAFEKRTGNRSEIYAYEQRKGAKLGATYEKQFHTNKQAWDFFQVQPPWYQRTAAWWVISAKREETRRKRLVQLMEDSGCGRTIRELRRTTNKK